MTPEETAKRILEGEMAPSQMKFSDFRTKMIAEHPEYVSDDEIHDLYTKRVMKFDFVIPLADPSPEGFDGSLTKAVDQAVAFMESQRPSVDEVRKVAERKPQPVRYSKKSRRKKKNLGDVTLKEAFVDGPRRVAKRVKSSRRSR